MRTEKRIEKKTIRHSKKGGLIALLVGVATFILPNLSSKENQEQLKSSPASPRNEDFDDDKNLGFVWEPAGGSFDHYSIYLSVDGSNYSLYGTTPTESCTIENCEEDRFYRIRVSAATRDGAEGPLSPESDRVRVDLTNPTKPEISDSQETETEDTTTFTLNLSKLSYDRNFLCYQKNGGPYTEWTNTAENENTSFVYAFTRNDTSGWHTLKIRGKDKAGRTGEYDSKRVYVKERIFGNIAYLEADSDSDGYSNLQELIAGTNPQDSNSFFCAEISNFSEGKIISWMGSPGKTYQVYRLDSGLENSPDNWMPVGPEIFVGDEREIRVLDKGVKTNSSFYKVRVR